MYKSGRVTNAQMDERIKRVDQKGILFQREPSAVFCQRRQLGNQSVKALLEESVEVSALFVLRFS